MVWNAITLHMGLVTVGGCGERAHWDKQHTAAIHQQMMYERWHAIKRAFHIVIFDASTADASIRADRGHQGRELAAKLATIWQSQWAFGDAPKSAIGVALFGCMRSGWCLCSRPG